MKTLTNFYQLLALLSGGRIGIAIISMLFPAIITMGFGVVLAYRYGYLLPLSVAITAATLLVAVPLFWASRKQRQQPQKPESTNPLWSEEEQHIWERTQTVISEHLQASPTWDKMDTISIDVLDAVAKEYDKSVLDFSVPEGLKLFEEVSRRYRDVLDAHVPAVEKIKLSHIKAGYHAYDQYGELGQNLITAAIWANHIKNLYINPAKVLSDLGKQQATTSMTKGLAQEMQYQAKHLLLDEVAAVSIDLYSGRFNLDDTSVTRTTAHLQDEQSYATELDPVRIVLVGQVSSGKSSLVNALKQQLTAEVDALPSTSESTVYQTSIDDTMVQLVDLKGLDGDDKTADVMFKQMINADLVLWVLKANQSARALDKALHQRFQAHYLETKHLSAKKPRLIAVVNQVDKLNPTGDWAPPYDLHNPKDAKGATIAKAVEYNHTLLEADMSLAVAMPPGKSFMGIELLQEVVLDELEFAANVQRNRQRLEATRRGTGIRKQLKRAGKLSEVALKKGAPKVAKVAKKTFLDK